MFQKTSDRMLDRRGFMKLTGGTALGAALIDINPRAIDKAFAAAPENSGRDRPLRHGVLHQPHLADHRRA